MNLRNIAIFFIIIFMDLSIGDVSEEWQKKVIEIKWICYSPSTADPEKGIESTAEDIDKDLSIIYQAGFRGLITYGSIAQLTVLAEARGFEGLIIGVWDSFNQEEIASAKMASKSAIVLGYCVGNEGYPTRYTLKQLSDVISDLKKATNKPVTTTEEINDYSNEELIKISEWVFPNAHPYFQNRVEPKTAVRWTVGAYEDLKKRTNKFIMFKEVGLPTAGDKNLSEESQESYYLELAKTEVCYAVFEAFDLPWKDHLPVEPHWGIFKSDRTPKKLALNLMKETSSSSSTVASQINPEDFYIYFDASYTKNMSKPTGLMGDTGDIHVNEYCETNPHSGATCIRVKYDAKGKGPSHGINYAPPAKWAGVYWQQPPNNWGENVGLKGKGFDLSGYERLVFWVRSDDEFKIEFNVGGIDKPYGDSLTYPLRKIVKITSVWQEVEINLEGADLKHIIGPFCWVTNWDQNPSGAVFYLDDIRFEKRIETLAKVKEEIQKVGESKHKWGRWSIDDYKILSLDWLEELDIPTAQELGNWNGFRICLDKLKSLDPELARELTKFKGRELILGIETLDSITAKELSKWRGPFTSTLALNNLTNLDMDTIKILAESGVEALFLDRLNLNSEIITILANRPAGFLDYLKLNQLTSLNARDAESLLKWKGSFLVLQGLKEIDRESIEKLAKWKGMSLYTSPDIKQKFLEVLGSKFTELQFKIESN